ncbi:MAG TPA: type II toxin-antitoxin system HipA family toxin [Gemmatimonadaceae bacterium]|jgi:serine/threonine-protein kinase HipA|nr:type II toxin-antitoxin system HipA family toxin [Gemmatimonadaceae bacterium]
MAQRALDVWMNGELVGVWYASRSGTPLFRYETDWLTSPRARPLSLSLPFVPGNEPHRGEVVDSWFDNLLPESAAIRQRIRRRFATVSTGAFDLLTAIGRDCVGAVQLTTSGTEPPDARRIEADPITDSQVAAILRGVTEVRPLGMDDHPDEFRISIAGAQEKTALLRLRGRWHVPSGSTPTTHMLKLPLGLIGHMRADLRDSVENEWLCMHLLGELGLPVPNTEIGRFSDGVGEEKALVVERFDREFAPVSGSHRKWITRLPQEDFCQALGVPAARKYESDGGPGIPEGLSLLAGGVRPTEDSVVFAKAQLVFWLLAAPDGHAKNFSIFLRRDGYVLTPLYDVISAWPVVGRGANQWAQQKVKLAMAVRGTRPHRELNRIAYRHWVQLASQTGARDALDQLAAMVHGADAALHRVESTLPRGFPEQVWTTISRGVLSQRERFLAGRDAAR